jgi:hypothetical protein
MAGTEQLALDGGGRKKRRAGHEGDISAEQLDEFFAALADSCNVAYAARQAGFSANWAYRRRKRDAVFRNQWVAAVREGYAKLELVLLERAMKGTPKTIRSNGSDKVIREYSNTLAVALLRRHAETVDDYDGQPDEGEAAELRARIIEQLDRLREREAGKAPKVEHKDAAARLATLCRALGVRTKR